jgi:hypothetical protein
LIKLFRNLEIHYWIYFHTMNLFKVKK